MAHKLTFEVEITDASMTVQEEIDTLLQIRDAMCCIVSLTELSVGTFAVSFIEDSAGNRMAD